MWDQGISGRLHLRVHPHRVLELITFCLQSTTLGTNNSCIMPTISLQVSSTSPEQQAVALAKAMSVRKASKKSGSRSSSSSSRRSLPPSGLSGSGSGSHRGQGSLPSQHVRMANTVFVRMLMYTCMIKDTCTMNNIIMTNVPNST